MQIPLDIPSRLHLPAPVRGGGSGKSAFTRTDLLVVILLLGTLAVLLLPTFAAERSSSQIFHCMNNHRRLMTGWLKYAYDNHDQLVRTGGLSVLVTDPDDPAAQPGGSKAQWVLGRVDSEPGTTDPDFIRNGLLYPYVKDVRVFKCPADQKVGANGQPTVRSVSMNAWMNPISTEGQLPTTYTIFRRVEDIQKPAGIWVLVDEHPSSINDGWFFVRPDVPIRWYDLPATYHQGAAVVSFADAHVEVRRWTDGGLLGLGSGPSSGLRPDPDSNDLMWLIERTTTPQ